MKQLPWLVFLSLCLASCSGSKSAQTVSQETPQIELSDADEFIENPNEEPAATEAPTTETSNEVVINGEENASEASPEADSAPVITQEVEPTPVVTNENDAGSEKMYLVKKNETLMMIAFKLYGNYGKWKEIANYNSGTLKGSTMVSEGMNLKYIAPAEEFVWNPEGLPYLIRTGDTLGIISTSVYQTSRKWKMIWENNRPLIKEPNKIFAGFTLSYLENGRDVAAEM